jgi:hypothetical protein
VMLKNVVTMSTVDCFTKVVNKALEVVIQKGSREG